jgi:hypothetical protein
MYSKTSNNSACTLLLLVYRLSMAMGQERVKRIACTQTVMGMFKQHSGSKQADNLM